MKVIWVSPLTCLFVAIISMVLLHLLLPFWIVVPTPWNLFGTVPLTTGIAFNLIADRIFRQRGTTVKPFARSSALVTTGVFKISRHPMYLGMVLILLGITILLGSLTPLTVVVIFFVLVEHIFIRKEERMLEEQFGEAWLTYTKKVRKWI